MFDQLVSLEKLPQYHCTHSTWSHYQFVSYLPPQVTEETTKILQHFGYVFEQRGLIAVKGKGELMTYYLVGKAASPHQVNGESLDYSRMDNQQQQQQ